MIFCYDQISPYIILSRRQADLQKCIITQPTTAEEEIERKDTIRKILENMTIASVYSEFDTSETICNDGVQHHFDRKVTETMDGKKFQKLRRREDVVEK